MGCIICCFRLTYASHQGLSPPATKGLSLKPKYKIMEVSSCWQGATQTQKAHQNFGIWPPWQAGRLQVEWVGFAVGFQSWLLLPVDRRTLAKIPKPWVLHLEGDSFYHEMKSWLCVIQAWPPLSRCSRLLTVAGPMCYHSLRCTPPSTLRAHCPASPVCSIIQSTSE